MTDADDNQNGKGRFFGWCLGVYGGQTHGGSIMTAGQYSLDFPLKAASRGTKKVTPRVAQNHELHSLVSDRKMFPGLLIGLPS
jgi:hypothetical protein